VQILYRVGLLQFVGAAVSIILILKQLLQNKQTLGFLYASFSFNSAIREQ